MRKQPVISIKLVLRAEDKVLILKHKNGTYHFPGGKLEWGESPEAALRRELREELNYDIPAEPLFMHLYNFVSPDKSEHMILLHYFLVVGKQPAVQTTKEGPGAEPDSEVLWLDKDELLAVIPNAAFIADIYAK